MVALRQVHLDSALDQFLPAVCREAPPDGTIAVEECEAAQVCGYTRTQSHPAIITENSIELPIQIDVIDVNIIMIAHRREFS